MPETGRWARLFDDLEGQLAAAERAELAGEAADRTRREAGRLTLQDRLRPLLGRPVSLRVPGLGELPGVLDRIGPDWLLLSPDGAGQALLPISSVLAVTGLGQASRTGDAGVVGARLDLRYALRGLVRDRAGVQVVLSDGSVLAGTLDRVGADFVELAEHPTGEPRRAGTVRQVRAIPIGAVTVIRTQ